MTIYADPFDMDEKSKGAAAEVEQNGNGVSTAIPELSGGGTGDGTSVNKGTPTSSGLQQDFGKFRNANANKITALGNLAVTGAGSQVSGAVDKVNAVGTGLGNEIKGLGKTFGSGPVKDLTKDSVIDADAIGKDFDAAGKTVGSGDYVGRLSGSPEAVQLNDTVNGVVDNLGTRAGTVSALRQANQGKSISSNAADQDSFLLRGNKDYQQQAKTFSDANRGAATSALDAQKLALGNLATGVNSQNQQYLTDSRNHLTGIQSGIVSDLDAQAAAERSALFSGAKDVYAEADDRAKVLGQRFIQDNPFTADPNGWATMQTDSPYKAEAYANDMANQTSQFGKVDDGVRLQIADALKADRTRRADSISASSVLGSSPERQKQIDALARLGVTGGPTAGTANTAEDESINNLLNALYPGYADGLRAKGKAAHGTTVGSAEALDKGIAEMNNPLLSEGGGFIGQTPEQLQALKDDVAYQTEVKHIGESVDRANNPFLPTGGITGRVAPAPISSHGGSSPKAPVKRANKKELR